MSPADPAIPHPDIPPGGLRAWYDDQHINDAVLYDITAQAAASLAALLAQKQLAAAEERERGHWAARVRLVAQQKAALPPNDRAGLIAQQQAWLHEAQALTGSRRADPI